ncbi:MAG: helix-turn-helix domain-containing protein [Ruminococcaceae bacterium]|nr:helix-turn-helix domain-containing protein [Oscillospiraceae bacterium]
MSARVIWEHLDDAFMQCSIQSAESTAQQSLHCLRLYFVLSGTLSIRIGSRVHRYGADEIGLINAHEPFTVLESDAVAAIFELDFSALDKELPELWFSRQPVPETNLDPFLILKSLLARYVKFNIDSQLNNTLLNRSMYYAVAHHLITFFRIDMPKHQPSANSKAFQMEQVARYIDQNYRSDLSLNLLAGHFYLSPPYLSRLFKQFYGSTFSEYLINVRLQNCLTELTGKTVSIEELSSMYGFPNSRSFIAHFKKKFGITPGQYRKQFLARSDNLEHSEVTYSDISRGQEMEVFAKYLANDISPAAAPSDILIRLCEIPSCRVDEPGTPLRHNFKNMISISSAADILSASGQEMLRTVQKDVGFRYVHFHGLLDDSMRVYGENENGDPELNFSRIDSVIDFLLSIGLKPFIELSYMPSRLARPGSRQAYYSQSIISLPYSNEKWVFLIRSLLRHLIGRYGRQELVSWPFSLWNLPDSGRLLGLGSADEFFPFYRDTWHAVKACDKEICFFSPSCMADTAEIGDFIPRFLELCRAEGCMPDMFQYHFYPVQIESYAEGSTRLTYRGSPSALKESISLVKQRLGHLPGNFRQVHITEWNASVSHRELLSDTAFQAAYIAKNILENYDDFASICYCAISDPTSDGHIARELFHGGMGLFTYNGIKKASYHALRLLSALGEEKLSSGEGYFISRSRRGVQIMLYNYQHYSELYARGEAFNMTFTNRYTPFSNAAHQKFTLSLGGFGDCRYLLTETCLGPGHGSSFDKWLEFGALPLKSKEDEEYLRAVSQPLVRRRYQDSPDGKMELSFTLEPHELRLIEICPVWE